MESCFLQSLNKMLTGSSLWIHPILYIIGQKDLGLSFHKIIEFEIKTDFEIYRPVKYQYESTDWNTFNKCLHSNFSSNGITPDISIDDKSALDNLASQITSIFTDTIKSCIKSTTNFKNRRLVPWWSKEISQTRKSVNKAQKQYQKSKLPADLETYRSFRNQYKYKIRKSKFENFKSFCSNTESPWALVKKHSKKNVEHIP